MNDSERAKYMLICDMPNRVTTKVMTIINSL